MCSRYRTARDIERLRSIFPNAPKEWFEVSDDRYDSFFPKSPVPVYLHVRGEEMFANFQWGIIPDWAKSKSNILTNTKSEEGLNKPTWIDSFKRRRCVLPATSFFEPANVDGKKYQMEFSLKDGSSFAFAGIWQKTEMFGERLNCCSILTCAPNALVGEIHERMPVILRADLFDAYLSTPPDQAERVIDLLRPFPAAGSARPLLSRTGPNLRPHSSLLSDRSAKWNCPFRTK